MKTLYNFTPFLIFILLALPFKGSGQCYTSYTTYNYFCDLDSLILEAVPDGVPPYSFIWETGETTQQIMIPLALGDYMLTVTDANGCVAIINCHVKPYPEVLYYPFNQNACEGEVVTLFLEWFRDSIPGATYLWSTGETTPSIQITDDITWSATVTDPATGCEYVIPPNLFEFHDVPDPEIVGPTEICDGQSITLSVNGGPFGYMVWYPMNEYTETVVVTEPGEYSVFANNENAYWCFAYDTIVITEGEIPQPILDGPPDLCESQSGTVEVTNHLLFETFLWSNGETGYSFIANEPGIYTVTVTDEEGCTASESIAVENALENDLMTDITAATCGESNGSIIVSYTISGSYDFLWSNGATTQNLEDVPSGTYSVTVTNENGCSSTIESTIPENEIDIVINENITPNSSCSEFNGAIDVTVTPSGDYGFLWSNGAVTEDVEGLFPGAYSITVTEGLTCTASADFIIEDISAAPDVQSTVTPATCGETNGAIDVQINGGNGPFNFLWSNGETSQDLANIPAGDYTITVTAADGCISISSIIVPNSNPPITINSVITPNTSCSGANGSIDITASPAADYDFIWSTGEATEDIAGIGSGTYTVTVSQGSCTTTGSFVVTSESLPFSVTGNVTPNTSCTIPNGSIDLNISPSGTYDFQWSSGETNEDPEGLPGGNYIVTVTNEDGCSITSSFAIENLSSPFTISGLTIANTSCEIPNGAVNITVNPTGAYSFTWSTGANTEDLQNISAGTFAVTVTDGNGCSADSSFTVQNQSAGFILSALSTPNNSCTNPTGAIDLSVSPAGTYAFIWSNGDISEDLQLIAAGQYTVTVTDNNSCSSTATYSIENNTTDPLISAVIINEICGAGNGSIDLSVTPAGSSFAWSSGAVTEDLNNIISGNYTVTVTAPNGCITLDTFSVLNTSNSFSLTATTIDNTSCSTPEGSINLTITPAGTYSILWSNGETTEDIQNLVSGTYSVTVTDAMSCSSNLSFAIQSSVTQPLVSSIITNENCGSGNGAIDLNATPTGSSFTWSTGATTEDLNDLSAGAYFVTVTGTNGCFVLDTFIVAGISNNFIISGTALDNSSCSNPNGSIDLSIIPAGTYSFAWSNGSATEDLQNLTAGTYAVTVTDNFNCSSTSTYIVLSNTPDPVVSAAIIPASCGNANGIIVLTISPSSGNTIQWSDGSTSKDIQNLVSGNYSVTVTASNGCSVTANYNVPDNNLNFIISGTTVNNSSCTNPNGTVELSITPAGTYSFAWSNGSVTEDLQDLTDGSYTVTVTDNFNCSSTATFVIQSDTPDPVISEVIVPASCGNANGSITLNVNPTSGNTFHWSDGSTTTYIQNLQGGNYSVTVTASNGCSTAASFTVPDTNSNFTVTSITTDEASCIEPNGSINLTVTPAGIYTFIWSGGQTTEDLANLSSGLYEVTVSDQLNCSASESFIIENITSPPLVSSILISEKCAESNGRIDLTVLPSSGNSFLWSTGDETEDLENLSEGNYEVTVTDSNGCTVKSNFELPGSTPIELLLDADLSSVGQGGTVTCSLQLNVPLSAIDSIVWLPSNMLSCHDPLCLEQIISVVEPTQISVMATDTQGCFATANLLLDINPEFKVFIPNVFTPNNDGPNDKFTVYANDEVEEVVILEIFDRWGNCVFINELFPPNEPGYGWDGIYSGKMMNPDVFAYRAVVRYSNGEEHHYKGDVTLVR